MVEVVEVTERGPAKYVTRRRRRQAVRVIICSERVTCDYCGEEFWRWEGTEDDACAKCESVGLPDED